MNQERHLLLKRALAGIAGLALVIGVAGGIYRAMQFEDVGDPDSGLLAEPDPLSAALRRCSALPHLEAMDDETCRRAWILNRQRFFGESERLLTDPPRTRPETDRE
ncbi:MAG: putative entry exclusion protein TrbK-alt [Sphingomonadales bacterium]|nr:putative entry exclusion protein TrbK-alt [Sphingomonadales bacterium]